jgi:hypothetical protein
MFHKASKKAAEAGTKLSSAYFLLVILFYLED